MHPTEGLPYLREAIVFLAVAGIVVAVFGLGGGRIVGRASQGGSGGEAGSTKPAKRS